MSGSSTYADFFGKWFYCQIIHHFLMFKCSSIYFDLPGSPCLSKKGESSMWFVPLIFLSRWLSSLSRSGLPVGGPKDPWPVSCRWRPRLAGTRQYTWKNSFFEKYFSPFSLFWRPQMSGPTLPSTSQ